MWNGVSLYRALVALLVLGFSPFEGSFPDLQQTPNWMQDRDGSQRGSQVGAMLVRWEDPQRSSSALVDQPSDTRVDNRTHRDNPEHQAVSGFLTGAEKLQRLMPSVQCDGASMTLRLRGRRDSSLLVDRADAPPVPLSRLPPDCGFSIKRARRDLLLVAPYNGCHVAREGGRYVLPLRVYGAPVKMSCPVTPSSPPTVSCDASNMVVKVEGTAADEVRVKVGESYEPLLSICRQCAYSVDDQHGHLLITVPYTSTCLEHEEAGLTLQLLTASGETTLSCPPVFDIPGMPDTDSDKDDVPPGFPPYPMFPPYYPMSLYPLYYPTVPPPTPRPVYPRYQFYPMNFPYMYPHIPLHVPANPASNGPMYPGYPFFPMHHHPYHYRKVLEHHRHPSPSRKN
ncbi:hypothetical protein GN956_G16327 [Arapaima gigas]